MATGRVKWFNNAKGYGFVLPEDGGEDLFVHHSSIQMEGYRTLKAGQAVDYDLHQGDKGMHAINVRALGDDAADAADAAEEQSAAAEDTAEAVLRPSQSA